MTPLTFRQQCGITPEAVHAPEVGQSAAVVQGTASGGG
jgi:hypothetical protein